jgi:hypothetical protein
MYPGVKSVIAMKFGCASISQNRTEEVFFILFRGIDDEATWHS